MQIWALILLPAYPSHKEKANGAVRTNLVNLVGARSSKFAAA